MIPSSLLCNFDSGSYLVFGPNVGPLQYYSHLPIIIISLALAVFIFTQNRHKLSNQVLFTTILTFVLWVFFDSIIWATNRSDVIMFMWSLQVLIEPLVYIGTLYLLHTLIAGGDVPFSWKITWFITYLPIILLSPTALNLQSFDITNCLAVEGLFGHYYDYSLEIVFVLWLLVFAIIKYRSAVNRVFKTEILALTIGSLLFLVAFSWGNITGSFTDDWQLAQYGLFGMPVFTSFLVYGIVKYQAFNIKIIGAVGLVLALIASTFALLFVNNVSVFREVAIATFVLSVIFGIMLIRGVNREVEQREYIEKLAGELQRINEQQEGLIHFIGHEVKASLTKDAGAFASIADGDFGSVPETVKSFVTQALVQTRQGVDAVSNILKASNLKKGTVTYTKEPFDLKPLVADAVEKARVIAEQKGLTISFTAEEASYQMTGDKAQISDHVLRNLIDNAVNYTPSGSITVSLKSEDKKLVFAVKDTGVGITEEDKKRLFTEGGHGKDSQTINAHSTGYGLYIAKQISEANGGTIRAMSEGVGKGSTFIVEFPV
jgi:signal transduction histidine kinase